MGAFCASTAPVASTPRRDLTNSFRNELLKPRAPRRAYFPDNILPKEPPRLVHVVRAAAELDVRDRRGAAGGIRLHVV